MAIQSTTASRRACFLVIGNHQFRVGISEPLYTLSGYFSRHCDTFLSETFVPGELNVLIDEFSNPAVVAQVRNLKARDPDTQLVVMATEFVTELRLLKFRMTNTFNYFAFRDDYRQAIEFIANRVGLRSAEPYMLARYKGFLDVLPYVDLILCTHQAVVDTLDLLPEDQRKLSRQPLVLFPELDLAGLSADARLVQRPAGFVTTGTHTEFRREVAESLRRAFDRSGGHGMIYEHIMFDRSSNLRIGEHDANLGYDDGSGVQRTHASGFIYNLNPPQRRNWRYSSPMRILRAVLMGQIPLVTRKFGDHELEELALEWDNQQKTADFLWALAVGDRGELLERHLAAASHYNEIAREKNARIDAALPEIA